MIRTVIATLLAVLAVIGANIAAATKVEWLQCLAVLGMIAAVIWAIRRLVSAPNLILSALVGSLAFASLLPTPVSLVVQMAAVVVPFVVWWRVRRTAASTRWVVLCVVAVLVLWTALLFHPNVPDILTGLEGWRKSVLALVGLVLGVGVTRGRRVLEDYVVGVLVAALLISIAGHLWLNPLVELVRRNAAVYTGEFGGEERLQGVFAGPFHIAAAAVLVIGWAGVRFVDRKTLSLVAIGVGTIALHLSLVRTAYVALAAVIVCLVIVLPMSRRLRLSLIVGGGAACVLLAVLVLSGALAGTVFGSIFEAASDGRVLNRFPGYAEALQLFSRSPVWGWGAGAAGDALGSRFSDGFEHVTSHNILLKILVEAGILGLISWTALAVVLVRSVSWRSPEGRVALVSIVGLLVFGVVGSSIEALPVTYFLFVLVGLAVRPSAEVSSGEMLITEAKGRQP